MPLFDSRTGAVRKAYSIPELTESANLLRGYDLICLAAAGSGHAGGTLSIMDVTAALYLHAARLDPSNPQWKGRDRIVWSAGHKAPSLYLGLGMAGFYDIKDVVTLRKLGSPFQGHPHWLKLPGVEVSTGSLGQGLSIAVGFGVGLRLDKNTDSKVFCLMGDGEQQEGQIWEAVMEAGHYGLDNLIGVVDRNRLQIDGWVKDVMNVEPLRSKYLSFGWHVIEIDGHDMTQIVSAFDEARSVKGKPTVILADTVKGKGVDFMENVAGWHGKTPSLEEMSIGLRQLGLDQLPAKEMLDRARVFQLNAEKQLAAKMPRFSRDFWWNNDEMMRVEMQPTRKGFGAALQEHGGDDRIVCLGLDISGSITISDFHAKNPERKERWLSVGIAEQSAVCVAAGLAREDKIPVLGTYGTFASGRCLDQIRTTVCYGELNVLIAGAHGGVSVGPDGATHQALEDLFQICGLPNMHVAVPCDAVETRKATGHLLFGIKGPKYIRFAREATPTVSTAGTPYVFGKANAIRFVAEQPRFIDAFETVLASEYEYADEQLAIVACGPMVPEAMRAAFILKKDFGIDSVVINMHTLKPLDTDAIIKAAVATGVLVTAEEHQIGGLADRVSRILTESPSLFQVPIITGAVGVKDRFGESGAPWELVKEFEVAAEHITQKALELINLKKRSVELRY